MSELMNIFPAMLSDNEDTETCNASWFPSSIGTEDDMCSFTNVQVVDSCSESSFGDMLLQLPQHETEFWMPSSTTTVITSSPMVLASPLSNRRDEVQQQQPRKKPSSRKRERPVAVVETEKEEPIPDATTSDIVYVKSQPRKKQEPISKKAAQIFKQRELKTMFEKHIPILTLRPFFKDVDHALFGCLPNLVVLWIFKMANDSMLSHPVFTSSIHDFIGQSTKVDVAHQTSKHNSKNWYFRLLMLDKEQSNIVSCYFNKQTRSCYIVDIVERDKLNRNSKNQLHDKVQHALQTKKQIHVHLREFALLNTIACCKYFPTFQPSLVCRKKLWHAIVFAMMISCDSKEEDFPDPTLAMQPITMQKDATISALVLLFAQSLLYHAIDNRQEVESMLQKQFPRQMKHHDALFNGLQKQRSTKPSVPSKRLCGNRIGKFKGRQTEGTFCIVVNSEIGFHVEYQQLLTTSLFELLFRASQQPNESEFDFSDLSEKLPMVFGTSTNERIHSTFQITTAYMSSRDPCVCFAPVMHMLWPKIDDPAHLVALNGKKWKLEFDIHAIACKDASVMERFLQATNYTPRTLRDSPLCNWVSVVDEQQQPYGIYYQDPHCTLTNATQWLNRIPGMKVTTFQKPIVLCPTKFGSIKMIQFIRDPFHEVWFGSRTQGIAIRRHYRKGKMHIRTFSSMDQFLREVSDAGMRLFLPCENVQQPCRLSRNTSLKVWNLKYLRGYIAQRNVASQLIVVDDLGPTRRVIIGHEPQPCWYDCAFCVTAQNNMQWTNNLLAQSSTPQAFCEDQKNKLPTRCSLLYGSPLVVREEECPMETIHAKIASHMESEPHTLVTLSALRNDRIRYMSCFAELQKTVFDYCCQYATRCGVTALQMHSSQSISAHIPKNCSCCRTPDVCFTALCSVLGVIQSRKRVRFISTDCKDIQGKLVQLDTKHFDIGIRCKHDWTSGLDIGFDLTVGTHVQPDVFICRKLPNASPYVVSPHASSMITTVLTIV